MSQPPTPDRRPVRKPPKPGWVGPLVSWELVRLARRGQDARSRFILASVLLLVLTLFTLAWFPNTPTRELFLGTSQTLSLRDSARFAEQFALTFMLAQLGVLVLLTPAYAAGGVAEEKEKKTFVFLLVSDLTSREIVLGKFVGRLTFLLGIMLAGLPVLALTLLYGGVSVNFLLMGYFLTSTTVVLLASLGVWSACSAETFRGAMFRAYGLSALHAFAGCGMHPAMSPFGVVVMLFAMEGAAPGAFAFVGFGYGGVQLACALIAVLFAGRSVRAMRYGPGREPPARRRPRDDRSREERFRDAKQEMFRANAETLTPDVDTGNRDAEPPAPLPVAKLIAAKPLQRAEAIRPPTRRHRASLDRLPPEIARRPPIDPEDPFLWKEKYVSGHRRDADDDSIRGLTAAVGVIVGLIVAFILGITLLVVLASGFGKSSLKGAQSVLVIGGSMGFFVYLLSVGSAACGAICRERQKMTLESLLTIPCDRREILWAKWRVCLTRAWWWGVPAAACVPLGLMAWAVTADPPPAGWGRAAAATDYRLPLQLGVICAVVFVAATLPFAVSYGLWLSTRCQTVTRAILWFLPMAGLLTLIPLSLWAFFDAADGKQVFVGFAGAAGITLLAAWLFWQRCFWAFEREGRA